MAGLEKACVLSFLSPKCTDDRFTLPHNFIYDIPLQSRGISKEIDVLRSFPAFKSMSLVSEMAMPFCEPVEFNFESVRKDPLQNILAEKQEFLSQLRTRLKIVNLTAGTSQKLGNFQYSFPARKASSSKREIIVAETSFIKLTEWVERDPYPYFSGSHLWFAVGGSISHLSLAGQTFVISPEGKSFDKIKIIPVDENGTKSNAIPFSTVQCTPGERIFQVVASKKKNRGVIGVRNLRGFSVLRLKADDNSQPKCRKLIDVSEPDNVLVCLDVSSSDGGTVCTLDKFNSVKVYDVSEGKCICDAKLPSLPNRAEEPEARFIQYSTQPSLLYITNKRKLYLKDIREPFDSSGTTFNVYDVPHGCEELSVTASSAMGDLLYCSSSHHSFALDPRKGWVKRWSHGLDDVPLYLNTGIAESFRSLEELVVAGNLEMGSTTGIIHSWKQNDDVIALSMCSSPALLPSIRDTALWANSKGFWLEPSIGKRVESSLSGMTIVPHKSRKGCTLFTLNAVGDVFTTKLVPDEQSDPDSFKIHKTSEVTPDGLRRIAKWEQDHMGHARRSSELQCASLEDRYFLCSMMKHHQNVDAIARGRAIEWRRSFKTIHTHPSSHRAGKLKPYRESKLSELSSHRDWLANEILPIWDMDVLIDEARTQNVEQFRRPEKIGTKRRASMAFSSDSDSD